MIAGLATGPYSDGLQVSLLRPHAAIPDEHIGSTGRARRQLIWNAVDAERRTIFLRSSHHHRVAADRHRVPKPVAGLERSHLSRLQVRLLRGGIDGDWIARAVVVHFQTQALVFADEAGGDCPMIRIEHLQT